VTTGANGEREDDEVMLEVHALRVHMNHVRDDAMLLRIVSVLSSRHVRIESLTFTALDGARACLTARVTLGNANTRTVRESLRQTVGVVSVDLAGAGDLQIT